jgi:hypothetical protein
MGDKIGKKFILRFTEDGEIRYVCLKIKTTYGLTKEKCFAKVFDGNPESVKWNLENMYNIVNLEVEYLNDTNTANT